MPEVTADLYANVAGMVADAERYADASSKDRIRATEYYRGIVRDLPTTEGRSSIVSRDLRATVKKALPSIMRTLFGSDQVVEYQPVGPGDEDSAQQATDYVNAVVLPEANIRRHVEDAIHDAMVLRNGILNWSWQEKKQVSISRHTGLTDDAFNALAADDDVEVLEWGAEPAMVEGQEINLNSAKIRRTFVKRSLKVCAVPRERFLVHPDAVSLDDSPIVGQVMPMTRSELVAMGYEPKMVYNLPVRGDDDDEEEARRDYNSSQEDADPANDLVDYYDLYVRVDEDGDGIAELRHMCFAGRVSEHNLLINEECDEVQYCDLKIMSQPHQWEGISIADDVMDIMQNKTVLLRQTFDNLYWQNNPQPVYQEGTIRNLDAVLNPEFGRPIRVREGMPVNQAFAFQPVPFVAEKSFGMLEYMDSDISDRTGISDAASGLAPDALQNMTAKASAMMEAAGIGQVELMVRTLAEGLQTFFGGILRTITRHQDVEKTVRLRNEWVTFDPRHWNADMDCSVNVGLGAGTRERDMMMMQQVLALQEKLLASFGAVNNPFVKPDNLSASITKLVEAAGLKTPTIYFSEPNPEEVQQLAEAAQNQPSPEEIKAQSQMQIEQAKMQLKQQEMQLKMQADAAKEKAQMDADLQVERARIEADTIRQRNELESKAALQERELQWAREKFDAEMAIRREEAAQKRMDDIQRDQASRIRERMAG